LRVAIYGMGKNEIQPRVWLLKVKLLARNDSEKL
jgi:hypothetical protein